MNQSEYRRRHIGERVLWTILTALVLLLTPNLASAQGMRADLTQREISKKLGNLTLSDLKIGDRAEFWYRSPCIHKGQLHVPSIVQIERQPSWTYHWVLEILPGRQLKVQTASGVDLDDDIRRERVRYLLEQLRSCTIILEAYELSADELWPIISIDGARSVSELLEQYP